MKYSQLLTKTQKSAKKYDSINATLLIQGGFIDQTMAGVYAFLPLGLRVLSKIEAIVREEMNTIGSEVLMTSLSPTELWEQTGRLETIDVLFSASGANARSREKNSSTYVLNSTHEELITPVAQKFNASYKDFPFAVYQIQTKFRNEARPKSGLLRGREFRMKDLYSFHTSEADLKEYYEKVKETYTRVYEKLGLGDETVIALASGGDFTKDFSHEFQTKCNTGEDIIFQIPSSKIAYNREVAPSKAPHSTQTGEAKAKEDVLGKGITGVEKLAAFLGIPIEKTTKTMIYEADNHRIIAAAVRGGYEINEEKLAKVTAATNLHLASADTVRRVTGAEVGYAGIIGLPPEVEVYCDESVGERVNFECGANKTNYHSINVNFGRDVEIPQQFYDFKVAKEGDLNPETGEVYEVFKASEVGNIFPLNVKFSKAFGYNYQDEKGTMQPVFMGSYGIGTSRLMGVMVEKFHDDRGIIWPKQVAPFTVHLVSIGNDPAISEKAAQLYDELSLAEIDVLWDDRDMSPGNKLTDADLIGCPIRLVVSAKTEDKMEWKERRSDQTELIDIPELIKRLKEI